MKRDLLVIAAITIIVLVAAFLLGPQFTSLKTGGSARTEGIPLERPDATPEMPSHDVEPAEPAAPLQFEVTDAVTGESIGFNTLVRLETPEGEFIDSVLGARGENIGFENPPLDRKLVPRVQLEGYVEQRLEPIQLRAGETRAIRVELVPLYQVTISPRFPDPPETQFLRVFSLTPPVWPETRAYSEWRAIEDGAVTYSLPPGSYWCQLPGGDPYEIPVPGLRSLRTMLDSLNASPDLALSAPNFLFEFEVKDAPMDFAPEVVWPVGELSINGRLVNPDFRALRNRQVRAVRCGPGCFREVAATDTTDEDGRFRLRGFPAGTYRVAEVRGEDGATEGAVWLGEVKQSEPAPEIELVTTRVPDVSENTGFGSVEVKILKEGEPVSGASLLRIGWGTVDSYWTEIHRGPPSMGKTDEGGLLRLRDLKAGGYVVRTASPHTLQLFDFQVFPGETTRYEFEIAPEGTGTLMGKITYEGADNLWCSLSAEDNDRLHLFWYPGEDGSFEVCGIPAGRSYFSTRDTDWYEYRHEVEIRPGEVTRFERLERTASVSGSLPYDGFWREGSSISYRDAYDDKSSSWSFYNHPPLGWDKGLKIDRVPRREFTLIAHENHDDRCVAVAQVDTSQGDVSSLDWQLLYAPNGEGGSLQVVSTSDDFDSPRTEVELSIILKSSARLRLAKGRMQARGKQVLTQFDALPPGTWTVSIKAAEYQTLEATIEIEAGKTTTVRLQPASADVSSQARAARPTIPAGVPEFEDRPKWPLPPRPQAEHRFTNGVAVWLFPTGASLDELWQAVVHVQDGKRTRTVTPVESAWRLNIRLVLIQQRPALLLGGLEEQVGTVTLRLPGRDSVQVELKGDLTGYLVDVP